MKASNIRRRGLCTEGKKLSNQGRIYFQVKVTAVCKAKGSAGILADLSISERTIYRELTATQAFHLSCELCLAGRSLETGYAAW